MNEPERFVIPGLPPTTNHGYGVAVRGGKAIMYKTAEAKAWQGVASLIINAGKRHQDWADCDIGIDIVFWCRNKNRDIDGGVKITLDTVAAALDFNDKRVIRLDVDKKWFTKGQEETRIMVWHVCQPVGGDN